MNKSERAYTIIRHRIENRIYSPGQRLVLDALARDLDISQIPIREAVRRLEAEGWIQYRPNSGPEVTQVSRETLEETMSTLAVLEGYATALAAEYMPSEAIARLRSVHDEMRNVLNLADLSGFSSLNRSLHQFVYSYSHNKYLVEHMRQTQARIDAAMLGTMLPSIATRAAASVAEHEELISAIESRRPFAEIEMLARQHKLNFLNAAMAHLAKVDAKRGDALGRALNATARVTDDVLNDDG